jgi:alpha-D-glucose phosphate-specific phosphoglucomutase
MSTHPNAGKPAPKDILIDVSRLEAAFYEGKHDPADPNQLVSFGTSGHRGTSSNATFTEAHILAITQAICEYRRSHRITGPLFMGKDTHALSRPAERVALEVLAGNGIETFIQRDDGFTPTPVISPLRTTRPPTAVSNTIRPTADQPTPTSPTGFEAARTSCCAAVTKALSASVSMLPSRPPRRTPRTLSLPT